MKQLRLCKQDASIFRLRLAPLKGLLLHIEDVVNTSSAPISHRQTSALVCLISGVNSQFMSRYHCHT